MSMLCVCVLARHFFGLLSEFNPPTSLCPFFGHDNSVIVTYRLMTYSFCVTYMYMYSEKTDTNVHLNIEWDLSYTFIHQYKNIKTIKL